MSLAFTVVLLLGSAALIYLACEYFVNGVEWVGRRLNLSHHATGTVLAAFGTALPESVVTFVAVAFGTSEAQKQIGVGAALGGPLVLATIAYAAVGATLWWHGRSLAQEAATGAFAQLRHDQTWFLVIFAAKITLGLVVFAIKPALGVLFLTAYALYVWRAMRRPSPVPESAPEPLKLAPFAPVPPLWLAAAQTLVALVAIFLASRLFVSRLETLGEAFGFAPQVLALLLAPLATELPETLNAIIWVRQGKVPLALANISGAMMIQATVPTAFGLFFTTWLFEPPLILAASVTLVAIAVLMIQFRRHRMSRRVLVGMAGFYLAFIALLILWHLTASAG